jgi:DNA-binding IclR family transcriptional regulator
MDMVSGVGVLDKAIAVIDALETGPRSLAELVEATGLARPTAHRLAVALEVHGLVRRDDAGRFTLGLRLIGLGRRAAEALPLVEAARPALAGLQDRTGESVQLFVRDGGARVCVASLEAAHELRTIVPVGARLPLEVGSAGRILGGGDGDTGGWPWVESVGERQAGVASVSAPVRDGSGRTIAAVSASGPIERTTRRPGRRYGEAVAAAARAIESSLRQ